VTDPSPDSRAAPGTADGRDTPAPGNREWSIALVLFILTCGSVWWVGEDFWESGWELAIPLMAILVAHEAGHYVAARLHGETPSPPYFLPLPQWNPFGTLGAVLLMDDRTRSRNALLDIGAAGPLAGLAVAIPVMVWGLTQSPVEPLPESGYTLEGQSLLYWLLKRVVVGPIPPGYDVVMHPSVGAAWAGFYVTFLNLLPFGQLDGGHVAFSLWGRRQLTIARIVLFLPAVMVAYNLVVFGLPALASAGWTWKWDAWKTTVSAISPWIALQILIAVMARWIGSDHPPTRTEPLSLGRRVVGWVTLALYPLLFAPSPWVVY
jgi:membrane-associated protease RseP (regulator of RpoE activity)